MALIVLGSLLTAGGFWIGGLFGFALAVLGLSLSLSGTARLTADLIDRRAEAREALRHGEQAPFRPFTPQVFRRR